MRESRMRPRWWATAVALVFAACCPSRLCAGLNEIEPEDLQPGLAAEYRSLVDRKAVLSRVEARPAFYLGFSSPHPRLPPGPFGATWTGVLHLKDPGPIRFDAYLCGEIAMDVDDVRVLEGKGTTETTLLQSKQPLPRNAGVYPLKIVYRSLPELPARLQIWWQGDAFSREPLSAWHLHHIPKETPRAIAEEQRAEQGRLAVGRLGCARCHRSAFPASNEPPPGPSLADAGRRLRRDWLLAWLAAPDKLRPEARMPVLFANDRTGFVERWLIADALIGHANSEPVKEKAGGDHRLGRRMFIGLGCAACHFMPDADRALQPDAERTPLVGLGDRLPGDELAVFLRNPHGRYPDGRMPRLPITPETARDIAAYLLLWSKPASEESPGGPPTQAEINAVARRLGVRSSAAGTALLEQKRCGVCHPGIASGIPADVAINSAGDDRGCLADNAIPRYSLDAKTREAIAAYRGVAAREVYPSPFMSRQRQLAHFGCIRCHQRNSDRPPPLEAIGSTLGGAMLQVLPFQRTPRLSDPHQKYTRTHLLSAVREGVTGLRAERYTYRMPAFGEHAETLVTALAEGDGELPAGLEPPPIQAADRTLGSLSGPGLAGFQGYSCVSCHIWNGKTLADSDPGAVGTELTRVAGRIRRDWFERFLEGPARVHPGTPMPAVFIKGKPALLPSVLDGDPARQKEAMWSYFSLGKDAPSPRPPPPLVIAAPKASEPPLVAQIPIKLPGGAVVESITLLFGSHDLFVYDLAAGTLHSGFCGAQILRDVQGRLRSFHAAGTPLGAGFLAGTPLQMLGPAAVAQLPKERTLHGYDHLPDGARIRWQLKFPAGAVELTETLRLRTEQGQRRLEREVSFTGIPANCSLEIQSRVPEALKASLKAIAGTAISNTKEGILRVAVSPDDRQAAAALIGYELPEGQSPPIVAQAQRFESDNPQFLLNRPGYRAVAYPRPKFASGEDRLMPGAVAVDPKDGRVFVASMKSGELFVLRDPTGDGKQARFDLYARGLFEEAFSLLAEPDALYVLHRRNLTRITDTDGDGVADRFDRVAALPHGVANTYDYGYGLVRDQGGAFVFSYAPYANTQLPGSGGAVRLVPGQPPRELAYGFRNPFGWCTGPDGDVFFTDNQGEWVAANKLCHVGEGRFYGFPNRGQRQHSSKPFGKSAVWVPYAWAKSINGVAYDNTHGKFGPFAGQFFLAELMYGGALVRADLEKVNGEYQGACFPFWGPSLLGPLALAFAPSGPLYVGSITEPGWMAQPDRGALFRIDYTGPVPFEIKTIRVLPRGFRIVFTTPVAAATARDPASYQIEHYRYEYTGAYGSPELDRTRLAIERIVRAADGLSVELFTAPLVKDRVYMIQAPGVRSVQGEPLVHPTGAYTLNEIPRE